MPVVYAVIRNLLQRTDIPTDRLSRRLLNPIVRAIRDRRGDTRQFELPDSVIVQLTANDLTVRRKD